MTSVPLPGAAKIRDRGDPAGRRRHDVRVVRIEDGEARCRNGTAVERAAARDGIGERVCEDEREVGAAVANQLEVVHRRGRHFSRRPDVRQILVQNLRQAAAVRIIDTAGAAGRDGEETGPRLAVVRAARADRQKQSHNRESTNRPHARDSIWISDRDARSAQL